MGDGSKLYRVPRRAAGIVVLCALVTAAAPVSAERRGSTSFLRGDYNGALYRHHRAAYRAGAALHVSVADHLDALLRARVDERESIDARLDEASMRRVKEDRVRAEQPAESRSPAAARAFWSVFRVSEWASMLSTQTQDILAFPDTSVAQKGAQIERAVDYYLGERDAALSCAPIEFTARRASVIGKPYYTAFRTAYPRATEILFAEFWWDSAIVEAQMPVHDDQAEPGAERVGKTLRFDVVLGRRPSRMLLTREVAPQFTCMSPEAANVADNAHFFDEVVRDVLAYPAWSDSEKRAELGRVLAALRYQRGDEQLARAFPRTDLAVDPVELGDAMTSDDGEMTRIELGMAAELLAASDASAAFARAEPGLRQKLQPGLQDGESDAALVDVMRAVASAAHISAEAVGPGTTDRTLVDAMLAAWRTVTPIPTSVPCPIEEGELCACSAE